MSESNLVIRINSGNLGGHTELHINGHVGLDIKHGTDTPVTASQYFALVDSNTEFEIVSGDIPAAATGEGDEVAPAPSPDQVEETDEQRAEREAAEADAKAKADAEAAEAAEQAKKDRDAEIARALEAGELGELNGAPFVAADVLAQPIGKISEDLDELSPVQLSALIAAENAADKPRTTLVTALQKKLG